MKYPTALERLERVRRRRILEEAVLEAYRQLRIL